MYKIPVLLACVFLIKAVSFAQHNDELAIRAILDEQTREWNKGDIESFMNTYWNSDSLVFIGRDGVNYGWQKTLNNYKKNYPDTASMGKLRFELVEIKRLSPIYHFVIGKWYLTRSIGDINGAFTLLFRKHRAKWAIVADHSSTALLSQ